MPEISHINDLLDLCTPVQRQEIFQRLRAEFAIHPLEAKLSISAEVILEAIARAPAVSLRGIRGLIAEAAFEMYVVRDLIQHGWQSDPLSNDEAYDFLLRDEHGSVRIQVKMQCQKEQRPMLASEALKKLPATMFVVETQRIRSGIDRATGQSTRPYRFSEFDILAVSMQPSSGAWTSFFYTVATWLLPRSDNSSQLQVFQPVSFQPDSVWTDSFVTCVEWLRSGQRRHIILE